MRERTLTVAQLNEYVKGVFEDELVLHDLQVEGEVYECKQTAAALFVTLRERDSLLHCVCFAHVDALALGDKVVLKGSVTFHERSGRVSFVFSSARKTGEGDLLAAFNARKDKLAREGVFEHKKPLPSLIRSLAVITGETGVVIHDFMQTLHRTRTFTDVCVYTAAVQGKTAAGDLIAQLRAADGKGYDVIVRMRGGGSSDDLSVFNDEDLVRAVAACATPTVSAIGHETDFTLCDFAASERAGTPSMAGEIVSRRNETFFGSLSCVAFALRSAADAALARQTERLQRCTAALSYKSEVKWERVRSRVAWAAETLASRMHGLLAQKYAAVTAYANAISAQTDNAAAVRADKLARATALLESNNPLRILSLGYAKLYGADGCPVAFSKVKTGEQVRAVLADGTIVAQVKEKKADFRR